jgi:glutathione synthase/RimK-type ligase-like ATP-grasp enzyme
MDGDGLGRLKKRGDMTLSIAIDNRPGSFSDRWADRARELGVQYQLVDCLDTRILTELAKHDGLLWHFNHRAPADLLVARHVIHAAQELGLLVFPSIDTCWSFDDKIAQKYQLEAAGAPMPQTDVFFSEERALDWIETATFPRVLKLRGGAGSSNVALVHNRSEARALTRLAFGRGLSARSLLPKDAMLRLARAKARGDLLGVLRRAPKTLAEHWRGNRQEQPDRGYVFFQEFLPDNTFDTRVTVIGKRAFAFTRNVRPNDFRASGSGVFFYDVDRINPECLRIAFQIAARLRTQSAAFDFALDREGKPKILEVSFGYIAKVVHDCPGYWDESLHFVEGHFWPQDAILEDLLTALPHRRAQRIGAGAGR